MKKEDSKRPSAVMGVKTAITTFASDKDVDLLLAYSDCTKGSHCAISLSGFVLSIEVRLEHYMRCV